MAAAVAPARAQDGGSQSVFAHGAGARALGMGGAYAALSGDATGMLWNPASLGALPRLDFEAGQTQHALADVNDVYAALGIPSWRWGTLGLSYRQFGVGGIEQRDDRNFLLGGTTADQQSELALGYGRGSENWSVGATLKLRRESLAGYSAGAFGADLGIRGYPALAFGLDAPWASRLTAGLSLTNALEPALRLDRESAADPTVTRLGVAYAAPVLGARTLTIAADLEQPAGLGARGHAGAALEIMPQLELRGGWDAGALAAGTEIRWKNLAVEYVFENREFETAHRIALRFAAGPTVQESRLAAQQKEDAAVEARLEQGFQKHLTDQVDDLVARANDLRGQKDWDGATDLLSSAMVLDPSRGELGTLAAGMQHDKARALEGTGDLAGAALAYGRALGFAASDTAAAAGLTRCKAEVARRGSRTTEASRLAADAFEAFTSDDLPAAEFGYERVLQLDPEDQEAQRMLARTRDRIAQKTQSQLEQARHLIDAGSLDEAAAVLTEVTGLDPQADGLPTMQAALRQAREAQRAEARASVPGPTRITPAAPSRPRLSARELDQLYHRGLDAMNRHDSEEATRYWELVWASNPKYGAVSEYLTREYLTRGMEAFAAGRLSAAVESWQRVLRIDPNNARAAAYVSRAQKQISRTKQILGGN